MRACAGVGESAGRRSAAADLGRSHVFPRPPAGNYKESRACGRKSSSGGIFRVGIRELLGTAGGSDGGGRGDVVGRTYPHLDMVTPIGRNIFYFAEFPVYVFDAGRTAQRRGL